MPLKILLAIVALALAELAAPAQTMPAPYRKYCAACHGENASGTDRGPVLIDSRSLRRRDEAQIRNLIRNRARRHSQNRRHLKLLQTHHRTRPIVWGILDTIKHRP